MTEIVAIEETIQFGYNVKIDDIVEMVEYNRAGLNY